MKRASNSKSKAPRHGKVEQKNKKQASEDSLDEIERGLQEIEENPNPNLNKQSNPPSLAKRTEEFIQKMRAGTSTHNIQDDGFFIQEKHEEQQNKKTDTDLRDQYLKDRNMYYKKTGEEYSSMKLTEPVVYKGHTKCITSVEWGPNKEHFFSCSKDGSIIKWDTETKKKMFLSYGKEEGHHQGEILTMSLNSEGTYLVTGGTDSTIKLWDAKSGKLIETLKSHKGEITSLKFGYNTNTFCSTSSDRTLKVWDAAQRTYIDTFYGHREEGLDIDCIDSENFISSGNDSQVIIWKTEKETQAVYNGHDYAIERVRMLNKDCFVTASQDSDVFLWNIKKKKPIYKCHKPHGPNWITSLATIHPLDIFATGSLDNKINFYQVSGDMKKFEKIRDVECEGIVTDLKISGDSMLVVEGDEHRLGRWITKKAKNQIKFMRIHLGE